MGLLVLVFAFSGAAGGTPIMKRDPQSAYVPDPSETIMFQSDLVRAMVPVDDATFWTLMLIEREERAQDELSLQDFLLSLKAEVSRLIPDWLRDVREDVSQVFRKEQIAERKNARAISQLSEVLVINMVPEARLMSDPQMVVAHPSERERDKVAQRSGKTSTAYKIPLSKLFLRDTLPGMFNGSGRFSGITGGLAQFGGVMGTRSNERGDSGNKGSRPVSGRLESITQWFHQLWEFLTGVYTYLALGAFLLVYLLVRYLAHRPRSE